MLAGIVGGYLADLSGTFTWSFAVAACSGSLGTFFLSKMKTVPEIYSSVSIINSNQGQRGCIDHK
jgi:hypothetical protein